MDLFKSKSNKNNWPQCQYVIKSNLMHLVFKLKNAFHNIIIISHSDNRFENLIDNFIARYYSIFECKNILICYKLYVI